jgi:fucose permease
MTPFPQDEPPARLRNLSNSHLEMLKKTQGWMTFFAVLFWLGAFLMALAAVSMMFVSTLAASRQWSLGILPMGLYMGLYGLGALLYVWFGLKFWQVRAAIERTLIQKDSESLYHFLDRNRSLWLTFGITSVVVLILYFLGLMVLLGVALLAID